MTVPTFSPLDGSALQEALKDCALVRRFTYFDEVDSTSTYARDHIRRAGTGADVAGTLVIAGHQTMGRGRHQRPWVAPPGSALLFSLIIDGENPLLQLAAPIAVAAAVRERTGLPAVIKWPNDILLGEAKVAGILLEREGSLAVVGIGVNVNQTQEDFPESIRQSAGSLRSASGRPHELAPLLVSVLNELERALRPESLRDTRSRLQQWCVTVGRQVRVETPTETIAGLALSITDTGSLMLRLDSGLQREILAADITHLRPVQE